MSENHDFDDSRIREELKDKAKFEPHINDVDDYKRVYAQGYWRAYNYLKSLENRAEEMSALLIQETHRRLFLDLYKCAGKWRNTYATFGGRGGADVVSIVAELKLLRRQERELSSAWQEGLDLENENLEYLRFLAFFHSRLIFVHPFTDGNGRVARLISAWQQVKLFNKEIDYPNRETYFSAMKALPTNFSLITNYFAVGVGLPPLANPLPPSFPIQCTIRAEIC